MINVIHKHGHSFKGLGAYLLHDVEAESDDRVAWTHSVNLATDDPDVAVKVMIATAKAQDQLKADAGVATTGRRSNKHVMHYSLSWHRDESNELTKDEMLQAALASMEFLGTKEGEVLGKDKNGTPIVAKRTQFADEHQAVIVCHEGEIGADGQPKAPHVHVMLNRVHPEHGVMLPDTNDYRRLSTWALGYRQAQGNEHLCPKRVKHAAMQAQGFATSDRRKSRQQYELEQAQKKANAEKDASKAKRLEEMRQKAAELAAKREQMRDEHRQKVHELEDQLKAKTQSTRDATAAAIRETKARLRNDYAPRHASLFERHAAEKQAFDEAQKTLRGRVAESWKALKAREWMRGLRDQPLGAVRGAFSLAFSAGLQRQQLEKFHAREEQRLRVERQNQERERARTLQKERRSREQEQQRQYLLDRADTLLQQRVEAAKQRAEWRDLQLERRDLMADLQPKRRMGQDAVQAAIDRVEQAREGDSQGRNDGRDEMSR